ncbi:hypothetical protein ACFLVR_04675 [Chloroflexota bacterium]
MVHAIENEVTIDAAGLSFRDLNLKLREQVACGAQKILLLNTCGQRYIGTDLDRRVSINIVGTPGNNLGSFMNGPQITVYGNAQDGSGNTMNEGQIVVHGHAGDITGLAARGGKIFIRDDVGYRAGIHMKEYEDKKPALVIGGTAQDFMGEYMAGGVLIMLGLNLKEGQYHRANYIGTGMHGGVIYIRGEVDEFQLGKEVGVAELTGDDLKILSGYVNEYAGHFECDADEVMGGRFIKLYPRYLRPYGRLYAY